MTIRLDDTIALVTGAAGGIGRAVCGALKDAGATVIGTDLTEGASIEGTDAYYRHDVTSEADWARTAVNIEAKYGRLDALVNAAAVVRVASIEETGAHAPPDEPGTAGDQHIHVFTSPKQILA